MPTPVQLRTLLFGARQLFAPDLIAEYRFDDGSGTTLTDYAGGYHGTLGASTAAPAWNTQGLTFDAVDDTVSLPVAIQGANKLGYTLMLVCKTPRVGDLLYSEGIPGTVGWFYITLNPTTGVVYSRWQNDGPTYDVGVSSVNTTAANTWCVVAARRTTNNIRIALNAVLAGQLTSSIPATPLTARTNVRLNTPAGLSLPAASGLSVAYLLVYHRYLSDAEVVSNYALLKTKMALRGIALP